MSFLLVLRLIVYRQGRLPVKWTAYEALMFNTYTTKSDVWVNRNCLEITVFDAEYYWVVLVLFILQINACTLFAVGAMALFFMRFLL